jgi:hypothetical protein
MWSVGNKSSFIPATTDAKVGLAKGLERATAAIAKAPVHDWKRAEVSDGKNHWIVSGDAPRGGGDRGPASSALDAHIELEQAMAASRKKVSAAGEASDSSAYDSSSSSSSSASGRRRRRDAERKERKGEKKNKKSSARRDEKRKKSKKRKDRKETKRRKRKRADPGVSSSGSDSEKDREGRVSAVSGKRLKLKLEGSNKRSAEEERRRREYLQRLNATVDLKVMENR